MCKSFMDMEDGDLCRERTGVYNKQAVHKLRYLESTVSARDVMTTGTSVPWSRPAVRVCVKRVRVL